MVGIAGRQDFAGRDDRLANEIVDTLRNIERTSRGSFDELVAMMTAARYSAVPGKIRKMNYLQLLSLRSLISGYQSRVMADIKAPLEASVRPELIAASALTVPQVLTMRRADGVIQLVMTGANGGNQVAHTFLPGNPGGIPDDTETLITTTPVALCHFCQQNERTLLFRNPDLNTDPELFSTTLDADGNFTAPVIVATLTPTSATHIERGFINDFCDGHNYWTCEFDGTDDDVVIHKVNLADGTITTQVIDNVILDSATANGHLFAVGDFCVFIGEDSVNTVTAFVAFELADGATPAALDLDSTGGDGIIIETAANDRLLGGFGGGILGGTVFRGFFTSHAAEPADPIHVIDFSPGALADVGATMADVMAAPAFIAGETAGWPIGTNARVGVSGDGQRLVMINNRTLALTDESIVTGKMFAFSLEQARQLHAMESITNQVLSLDVISQINVALANMQMLATDATGQLGLEVNA